MIGLRFGHYRILRQLGVTRAMKMIKELAVPNWMWMASEFFSKLDDQGAPEL